MKEGSVDSKRMIMEKRTYSCRKDFYRVLVLHKSHTEGDKSLL